MSRNENSRGRRHPPRAHAIAPAPLNLPHRQDASGLPLPGSAPWRRPSRRVVRAVLLAGDVVDRDDDFFEAYGHLARGVRRLADADIEVIGVAGNHDVKVLPRLANEVPAFRLLGAGGEWEHCEIADGRESLTVWGWSFPQPRVIESPLPNAPFKRELRPQSRSPAL